jgi:hypothetical protein
MSELLAEVGLRLLKAGVAALLGVVMWLLAVGPLGASPSVELALLAWLSGAAVVLLVQESPL